MEMLGKKCTACGRERSKTKAILYDPNTLLPYCEHPYICNTKHPNTPMKIVERGGELKLITYNEAQKAFKDHLMDTIIDPEQVERIKDIVDKPKSIRISSPELAKFLVETQEKYGFDSLSDTIRHCIRLVMENELEFYKDFKQIEKKKEEQRKEEELTKLIEEEVAAPVTLEPEDEGLSDDDLVF